MTDTRPTVLDRAIQRASQGELSMQSVMWTLASSTLFVPSGADPGDDFSGFQPVYYPRGDVQMLAAFSSPDGASTLSDLAPYLVTFTGDGLLARMPRENGLVVNPGSALGFDIPPDGLAAFRQEASI